MGDRDGLLSHHRRPLLAVLLRRARAGRGRAGGCVHPGLSAAARGPDGGDTCAAGEDQRGHAPRPSGSDRPSPSAEPGLLSDEGLKQAMPALPPPAGHLTAEALHALLAEVLAAYEPELGASF